MPLRNALATLAIAALEEDDAYAALAWLADPGGTPPAAASVRLAAVHLIDTGGRALLPVHAPHAGAVAAHAARALRAAGTHRASGAPSTTPVTRAACHAMALWNEGLFFEVHEVLEEVWKTASGDLRQALQGLIQVAVAYHHLAHGNPRGARSLLREGRERLAQAGCGALPVLDVGALVSATAAWEEALTAGHPPPTGGPPRLAGVY